MDTLTIIAFVGNIVSLILHVIHFKTSCKNSCCDCQFGLSRQSKLFVPPTPFQTPKSTLQLENIIPAPLSQIPKELAPIPLTRQSAYISDEINKIDPSILNNSGPIKIEIEKI